MMQEISDQQSTPPPSPTKVTPLPSEGAPLTSLHLAETSTPRFETGKVFVDAFRVKNGTKDFPTHYGSAHLTVSRHLFYCSWLNRLFIGSHQ